MRRRLFLCLMVLVISCDDGGEKLTTDTDTERETSSDSVDPTDTVVLPGDSDSQSGAADTGGGTPGADTYSASDGTQDTGADSGSSLEDGGSTDRVSDTETDTGTDTGQRDSQSVDTSVQCPEGSQLHTSASGKMVCCSESKPVFCDENEAGYTGSCWSEGVNCDSIIFCGGVWRACKVDTLPWCDPSSESIICFPCPAEATAYWSQSGKPACCDLERPVFCDENDAGYTGGCWAATIECSTIVKCSNYWGACPEGSVPVCEDTRIICQQN